MNRNVTGRLAALVLGVLVMLCAVWPAALAQEYDTFNLLLIGEDASAGDRNGRSDAMMLAQITPATGDVKLVSFLRDLYVPVPGHGRTRLNAAYFYGGEELLKRTLADCFGVRIDRTAAVDFAAMADVIDRMGGVELTVTEAEVRELNSILATYCRDNGIPVDGMMLEHSGTVALNGLQALSYSRIRSLDSDFGRVNRQQQVLAGLLNRAAVLAGFTLLQLALQNMEHIRTDLTLSDLVSLLPMLSAEGGPALSSARVPFDNTCRDVQVDGMWVLDCDMAANTRLLKEFLAAE